jgi:hypothetical protein
MRGRKQTDERIDPEAPASRIMRRWGSNSAFARAIGKTHSTTQRWLITGEIPPDEQEGIIAAAKRDRVKPPIRPTDFVDERKFDVDPAPPLESAAA